LGGAAGVIKAVESGTVILEMADFCGFLTRWSMGYFLRANRRRALVNHDHPWEMVMRGKSEKIFMRREVWKQKFRHFLLT
jgi:hypothetical protein